MKQPAHGTAWAGNFAACHRRAGKGGSTAVLGLGAASWRQLSKGCCDCDSQPAQQSFSLVGCLPRGVVRAHSACGETGVTRDVGELTINVRGARLPAWTGFGAIHCICVPASTHGPRQYPTPGRQAMHEDGWLSWARMPYATCAIMCMGTSTHNMHFTPCAWCDARAVDC